MKVVLFLIGLVVGGLVVYFVKLGKHTSIQVSPPTFENSNAASENWKWPDSLDALRAAPGNHELIFENNALRVLIVTVIPGILDPIHTHKGKSLVWVTMTSPILYHHYDFGKDATLQKVKTDTIDLKPEEMFKGSWEKPEPPHSVENIGKDTFQLYRIEYKQS